MKYKVKLWKNGRLLEKTFRSRKPAIEFYQTICFSRYGTMPIISEYAVVYGQSDTDWSIQFEE